MGRADGRGQIFNLIFKIQLNIQVYCTYMRGGRSYGDFKYQINIFNAPILNDILYCTEKDPAATTLIGLCGNRWGNRNNDLGTRRFTCWCDFQLASITLVLESVAYKRITLQRRTEARSKLFVY